MQDYSQHKYRILLKAIEDGCQKIGEKRDYVSYLLSMEQAESIERLIEIYDNIYKLYAIILYSTSALPKGWYKMASWNIENLGLNKYLNENILKLFKTWENPTDEQRAACIANLRYSNDVDSLDIEILKNAEKSVRNEMFSLSRTRYRQYIIRNKIENDSAHNPQYNTLICDYTNLTKVMAGNGRIFDVSEIYFSKDYGIKAYDELVAEYKEDRKRQIELEKQKVAEKAAKENVERNEKTLNSGINYILIFVVIIVFAVIAYIGFDTIFILIGLIGLFLSGRLIKMGGK